MENKLKELIDLLYENNTRCDCGIEDLAEDIINIMNENN